MRAVASWARPSDAALPVLAGRQPTAGFFAKFYVLVALVERGFVGLAVIAVLSAVAAYFYLRIVAVLYMREPTGAFEPALTPWIRTRSPSPPPARSGSACFRRGSSGLLSNRSKVVDRLGLQ